MRSFILLVLDLKIYSRRFVPFLTLSVRNGPSVSFRTNFPWKYKILRNKIRKLSQFILQMTWQAKMGELVSYLKTCMVYASIPLMYLGISMLKLAYLVAPHVVLKGVKNMSNRLPGMGKILQNAESAADVNFFFSNEYIKVIISKHKYFRSQTSNQNVSWIKIFF